MFWGPMLRGKFGEDHYDEVGMAWVWGKVHTRFASRGRSMAREQLGYPMGSFGEVFEVLAARIRERGGEVHTSASVHQIAVEDGRAVGMEVEVGGTDTRLEAFDAVISTAPLPRIRQPAPSDARRLCGQPH